jgi:alkane 1-monooxygenase
VIGLYSENADPMTEEKDLRLYRLVTMIWAPLQIVMIFGLIWYVQTVHPSAARRSSASSRRSAH